MACIIALFALISARLAIVILWLFTNVMDRAFESFLLPFLGFLFLPWTTLTYAVAYQPVRGVEGFGWFLVIFAFLIDLGSLFGGMRSRRQRWG